MVEKKGIEVGNIFQLGYYYSEKMRDALFTDVDGKRKPFYMGCYGIGIGRTMATVVEVHHDKRGIVWPKSIAPYLVNLIGLDLTDAGVKKQAEKIYQKLSDNKLETLYDDRADVSAGEKFGDADLIGTPYRAVVSKRTGDKVELKKRASSETKLLSIEELLRISC
jgi:prolyl-tRNA synthetase